MKYVIHETTDYKKFRWVVGNRKINPNHVRSLEKAVAEHNLLAQNPIIVNKNYEIIDGQHRLAVAKRMHIPIYYVVVGRADLQDIRLLNVNVRMWAMEDYLRSYILQGKKDYSVLKEFAESNGLSISIALLLLSIPDENFHPNLMIKNFKEGEFKATNIEGANKLVKQLYALRPYTLDDAWRDRDFIRALQIAYKRASHAKLMEKLAKHDLKIEREPSVRDYLRALEKIVNFKQRGNIVRLF